jgi:hypothetical protein
LTDKYRGEQNAFWEFGVAFLSLKCHLFLDVRWQALVRASQESKGRRERETVCIVSRKRISWWGRRGAGEK